MFCPAVTPPGPVFVICRSACDVTVVLALAVLFAPLPSNGEETVALFEMVPPFAGASIETRIDGNCEPLAIASIEVQVIVPADGTPQLQFVPNAEAPVTPAGSVSTTVVVPPVVFGPLFVMSTV